MSERIIAVGDVHGCHTALRALIDRIEPRESDVLVMLGDCVDRGPDSRGVIDLMMETASRCRVIPLFGNHEEMLLMAVDRPSAAHEWRIHGGRETLASYGVHDAADIPRSHLLYVHTWFDYWETPTHFFAHGNYDPRLPLDQQEWSHQRWQPLQPPLTAPHVSGKTAILGHTSQKTGEILDAGHLVCIDTYCCGGGWLTGYDVGSQQVWQVDQHGKTRPD